jgi:hypothetical protein
MEGKLEAREHPGARVALTNQLVVQVERQPDFEELHLLILAAMLLKAASAFAEGF